MNIAHAALMYVGHMSLVQMNVYLVCVQMGSSCMQSLLS